MSDEDSTQLAENAFTSLRQSVHAALERKMRLGQYAVIIENGAVLQIGPNEIARQLANIPK